MSGMMTVLRDFPPVPVDFRRDADLVLWSAFMLIMGISGDIELMESCPSLDSLQMTAEATGAISQLPNVVVWVLETDGGSTFKTIPDTDVMVSMVVEVGAAVEHSARVSETGTGLVGDMILVKTDDDCRLTDMTWASF